jgi:hypothetical protein
LPPLKNDNDRYPDIDLEDIFSTKKEPVSCHYLAGSFEFSQSER